MSDTLMQRLRDEAEVAQTLVDSGSPEHTVYPVKATLILEVAQRLSELEQENLKLRAFRAVLFTEGNADE